MTKEEHKEVFASYIQWIDENELYEFSSFQKGLLNQELPRICNAALLSKNTDAAYSLLLNLAGRKKEFTGENWAVLCRTQERMQKLIENGGWLPVINRQGEEEPEIQVEFPKHAFPPAIETYCDDVAANVQVDRAMICVAVLAACALCMQGKFVISYPISNGHYEHLCLYIVIVACPGERKSSTFKKALLPVRMWQKEHREQYKLEWAEYQMQQDVLCGTIESKKRQLQSKSTTDEQRQQLSHELTALSLEKADKKPPVSPEILATDTTVEALSGLMALTGETAGIFTDEADFLKILAGLYNKGSAGNLQLPLCALDGAPFFRVRGSGTISLERPLLSMCLFAQPVLFEEIQKNNDLKGRGMVGRLLFCTPKKQAGKRIVRNSPPINKDAQRQYVEILQRLLDLEQKDDETIPEITWEPDAAEYMLDYLQKVEDSMKDGNPMEEQTDYASKAGGVVLRISGILHVLWTGGAVAPVSLDTARRAVGVHRYFFAEKMKEMQQEETQEQRLEKCVVEKLLELTVEQGNAYTTVSALQRKVKNRNGLKTSKELEPFLEMLQSRNAIDIVNQDKNKRFIYISPYFQK